MLWKCCTQYASGTSNHPAVKVGSERVIPDRHLSSALYIQSPDDWKTQLLSVSHSVLSSSRSQSSPAQIYKIIPNWAPHFCSYCPWNNITPQPKEPPTHPKAFSGFPVFKKHLNPLLDTKDIFSSHLHLKSSAPIILHFPSSACQRSCCQHPAECRVLCRQSMSAYWM